MAIFTTAKKKRFVEWLASPVWDREPATQDKLAAELGLHPVTLSKEKSKLSSRVNAAALERLRQGLPSVFGSMLKEASTGSYQHAKLILDLLGEMPDKTMNINANITKGYVSVSPDDWDD